MSIRYRLCHVCDKTHVKMKKLLSENALGQELLLLTRCGSALPHWFNFCNAPYSEGSGQIYPYPNYVDVATHLDPEYKANGHSCDDFGKEFQKPRGIDYTANYDKALWDPKVYPFAYTPALDTFFGGLFLCPLSLSFLFPGSFLCRAPLLPPSRPISQSPTNISANAASGAAAPGPYPRLRHTLFPACATAARGNLSLRPLAYT